MAPGQVRIIAGRWRGRKLSVPEVTGLRPTGDRMRETLFNWLQPHVAGARCLDLFAGSGALGFEALSRYAASAVFIEPDTIACQGLAQSCSQLGVVLANDLPAVVTPSDSDDCVAHVYRGEALQAVKSWRQSPLIPQFDLVFIDPPFRLRCQWDALAALTPLCLADNALIYVESPNDYLQPENLPPGCKIVREKCQGEVTARLVRFVAE